MKPDRLDTLNVALWEKIRRSNAGQSTTRCKSDKWASKGGEHPRVVLGQPKDTRVTHGIRIEDFVASYCSTFLVLHLLFFKHLIWQSLEHYFSISDQNQKVQNSNLVLKIAALASLA